MFKHTCSSAGSLKAVANGTQVPGHQAGCCGVAALQLCRRWSCCAVPEWCLWLGCDARGSAQAGSSSFFILAAALGGAKRATIYQYLSSPSCERQGGRGSTGLHSASENVLLLCLTVGSNFHCLSSVSLFILDRFPSLTDANLLVQESAKGN